MDDNSKFIQQKDSRTDAWKNVAKSDRLIRRYAGDAFAETRLDDGLHAIVDKDASSEEKKLSRQQRTMGINWPSLAASNGGVCKHTA